MLRLMVSRRWWFTTILLLVGIGLTIRLGIWQVDRYLKNTDFANHLAAMQRSPILVVGSGPQPPGLIGMEYRAAQATGTFDFSHQIAIKNQIWVQTWGNDTGYILVAPLVFPDGSAIMVDRGWIPLQYSTPSAWRQFNIPGVVTVSGVLRLPAVPEMGGEADPSLASGQASLVLWNLIDLRRLQNQMPYRILPVYIEQAPEGENTNLPFRAYPEPDLSEAGVNEGYAMVWFTFTALLIFGYPVYLGKQTPNPGKRQ